MNEKKTEVDLNKYPKRNEDIDVTKYHKLVLKVYSHMVRKFGPWLHRHKDDLVQGGYIGLLKAKEKYVPGRGSFLGLAYLRIMSAMQSQIAKYAEFEVNTTPIEGLKFLSGNSERDRLSWDNMFSSEIVDYEAVIRMVRDEDDSKLLYGIIQMYPYWKLRAVLKETKSDHESRVARIKEELREILGVLYPNS